MDPSPPQAPTSSVPVVMIPTDEPPSKRRRVSHDSSADEHFFDSAAEQPTDGATPSGAAEDGYVEGASELAIKAEHDDDTALDDTNTRLLTPSKHARLPHAHHLSSPASSSVNSPPHPASTPVDSDYYTDQASSPLPMPDADAALPHDPATARLDYKPRLVLKGHKRAVSAVKFSPDGRLIASASADATARIWDARTGKPLATLAGHLAGLSTLAWSPDSATLATGADDKAIRLWRAEGGRPYARAFLGHHNYISAVAFSPKGNVLVSGSHDEAVYLWDVRSRAAMRQLPAHGDPVAGVDFSHDGTLVASCAADGLVRVWDVGTGQCLRTFFHEDTPPAGAVRFSPNSLFVATWMLDGSVRLWNYIEQRARCVKTYQGHKNARFAIAGAFGAYVPTEDEEERRNEHLDGEHDAQNEDVDEDAMEGVETGEDAAPEPPEPRAFLVSGGEDGALVFWDVVTKAVLQRVSGRHAGVVFGVDVHGRSVVSCGQDRTLVIWREDD